jgi:hypothetical protein
MARPFYLWSAARRTSLAPTRTTGGRTCGFYTLGFTRGLTVPEQSPFVFASVSSGPVEIFFNDAAVATKEYPAFAGRPTGT